MTCLTDDTSIATPWFLSAQCLWLREGMQLYWDNSALTSACQERGTQGVKGVRSPTPQFYEK